MRNRIFSYLFLLLGFGATVIYSQDEKYTRGDRIPRTILAESFFHHELDEKTEQQYLQALDNYIRAELLSIKKIDKEKYNRLLSDAYFKTFDYSLLGIRGNKLEEDERI